MAHEAKVEEIKRLIDEVHGDTSVSKSQTLEALEEIASHVDPLIDALREEIDDEDDFEDDEDDFDESDDLLDEDDEE